MIYKLHMWAFPGLGESTDWIDAPSTIEAEDPEHAVELFSRRGWSGMCSLEDEGGRLTHHQLSHRKTGGWTAVMRAAFLRARGAPPK